MRLKLIRRMPRERLRPPARVRYWSSELVRSERWALLSVVAIGLVANLILGFVAGDEPEQMIFQSLLTLAFALPLINPAAFVAALLLLALASVVVDAQQEVVLALALGAGIVVRMCSGLLQFGYFVAFVGIAVAVHLLLPQQEPVSSFISVLIVAVGVSILGFVLRASAWREVRSRRQLLLAAQTKAEVAFEERRRLADDLHDIVAHDLTVITMHARLLGRTADSDERRHSEQEIIASARKALADVRRVVMLGQDSDGRAELSPHHGGVSAVLEELRDQLTSAGYHVVLENEIADDDTLDRLTSGALARIAREAATNVLKHAPRAQRVTMSLTDAERALRLRIWNSHSSAAAAADVDSGGYGIMRMSERADLLGGTFRAGAHDGGWLAEAVFPYS